MAGDRYNIVPTIIPHQLVMGRDSSNIRGLAAPVASIIKVVSSLRRVASCRQANTRPTRHFFVLERLEYRHWTRATLAIANLRDTVHYIVGHGYVEGCW